MPSLSVPTGISRPLRGRYERAEKVIAGRASKREKLAFLVFWIDPEDLSSQVNIGVTCVLSAIAFQFVQASTLPEVAYTTLTDRVYVISYIAIALAQSVNGNALVRRQDSLHALVLGRRSRWLFPVATIAALLAVVVQSAVIEAIFKSSGRLGGKMRRARAG